MEGRLPGMGITGVSLAVPEVVGPPLSQPFLRVTPVTRFLLQYTCGYMYEESNFKPPKNKVSAILTLLI